MQELPKKTDSIADEVEEVIEKLPPEARQIIRSTLSVSGSVPVFTLFKRKLLSSI
jgi:hypothetical protein